MEIEFRRSHKDKDGTWAHERQFVGGEFVTIYDAGIWNYEDFMAHSYTIGIWDKIDEKHAKIYEKHAPEAVKRALEDLGYAVEVAEENLPKPKFQ